MKCWKKTYFLHWKHTLITFNRSCALLNGEIYKIIISIFWNVSKWQVFIPWFFSWRSSTRFCRPSSLFCSFLQACPATSVCSPPDGRNPKYNYHLIVPECEGFSNIVFQYIGIVINCRLILKWFSKIKIIHLIHDSLISWTSNLCIFHFQMTLLQDICTCGIWLF